MSNIFLEKSGKNKLNVVYLIKTRQKDIFIDAREGKG
jgi:hypothetical protein